MFDTQTQKPYCVFVENGDLKKIEGDCEEISMSPVSSQSGQLSLAY
ncbi:MAG: hypothetical protein U9O78_02100 [Patescibacteria group bacterium]|nr:hypothetical protein [Patescibacteria group bacterium]